MKAVRSWAIAGLLSLSLVCAAEQVRAQTTVLASTIAIGTTYTYGDTTFKFTSCSACSNLELLGVNNGRGGTEIEVLTNPSTRSYIFTNSNIDQSINFNLAVGTTAGSRGISSVTNIVNGSDNGTSANDAKVTSTLSAITGTGAIAGTLVSTLNESPVSPVSWPLQTAGFSLTDTLSQKSNSGTTLSLTNVQLLFYPAPEPASLALFASGLVGLIAARRRFGRRDAR